jgi:histidyl-tRNA synthetase
MTEARLPRGFRDVSPAEIAITNHVVETIRKLFSRYGFDPIETPLIEYTDALGKFLPDQDRPNEGVFSFQDDDSQWLSLRYDLTAPLARYVAEHFRDLPMPFRSSRAGYVFRNEKPGPGRFRQFMQLDADTVGAPGMTADAEMCAMAADAMEALGVPRGGYVVKVNSRKVLDDVLDAARVPSGARLTVLRAIDKLDRLGARGVEALLGDGRRDESGDFTSGARLDAQQRARVLDYLTGGHAAVGEGADELAQIAELCGDRVRVDSSVVRGLEYYTGPVYELELIGARVGSVGGGGRYDGLISRFRPEPVPATGFSFGVSRIVATLGVIGARAPGPVFVAVFSDGVAQAYRFAALLRSAGVPAEMYQGAPSTGLGQQLRYAARRNSPLAVIQGSNERAQGCVQIKDLVRGAALSQIKDRAEYKARQSEAQVTVSESVMIDTVRNLLRSFGNTSPGP